MAKNQVLFKLTREDVEDVINELDLPYKVDMVKTLNDDFLARVKKGLEWGLSCWHDVMKEAVMTALEEQGNHYQPLLIQPQRRQ